MSSWFTYEKLWFSMIKIGISWGYPWKFISSMAYHGIMVAFPARFGCSFLEPHFKPEEFCEWNVHLHTVHYCTLKCELYLVVPLCLYSRNSGYACIRWFRVRPHDTLGEGMVFGHLEFKYPSKASNPTYGNGQRNQECRCNGSLDMYLMLCRFLAKWWT